MLLAYFTFIWYVKGWLAWSVMLRCNVILTINILPFWFWTLVCVWWKLRSIQDLDWLNNFMRFGWWQFIQVSYFSKCNWVCFCYFTVKDILLYWVMSVSRIMHGAGEFFPYKHVRSTVWLDDYFNLGGWYAIINFK